MGNSTNLDNLRIDVVGSLLRKPELKEAFAQRAEGLIGEERLGRIQDAAIQEVVAVQDQHDLPVIVDGEFRRTQFMESFADVAGFGHFGDQHAAARAARSFEGTGVGRVDAPSSRTLTAATEPLRLQHNRPLDEYRFAQSLTNRPVKVTLTGPDRIMQVYDPRGSWRTYRDPDSFLADVVGVLREILEGLIAAGCRYIQIDAPGFTAYLDEVARESLGARGWDPDDLMRRTIAAENAVIKDFSGVTFGIHLCRGNEQSHWHREGTYDAIAEQLFGELHHQRLLLEYDSDRAGTFHPLRYVPDNAVVVLGLVSTKSGELETVDELCRKVEQASSYVPLDRLAISPQCGFASTIEGNNLTEDQQWAKLDLLMATAEKVWGGATG